MHDMNLCLGHRQDFVDAYGVNSRVQIGVDSLIYDNSMRLKFWHSCFCGVGHRNYTVTAEQISADYLQVYSDDDFAFNRDERNFEQ